MIESRRDLAALMASRPGTEPSTALDTFYAYLGNRPSWVAEGACRDADPALFFPGRGESTAPAKAICAECPVRSACEGYALADPFTAGIWGGTSDNERKRLRRAARQEAA